MGLQVCVALVGDAGCGKTALAVKFTLNLFMDYYHPTESVQDFTGHVDTRNGDCKLTVLDTSSTKRPLSYACSKRCQKQVAARAEYKLPRHSLHHRRVQERRDVRRSQRLDRLLGTRRRKRGHSLRSGGRVCQTKAEEGRKATGGFHIEEVVSCVTGISYKDLLGHYTPHSLE